jgi:hypothetical protein
MTMPDSRRTTVVRAAQRSDAPVAHRMDRDAERSDPPMNALTDQYVRQHLQELRAEGATHRAFNVDRPSLLRRIATALSGHTGRTSTSGRITIGLALNDDPFRG